MMNKSLLALAFALALAGVARAQEPADEPPMAEPVPEAPPPPEATPPAAPQAEAGPSVPSSVEPVDEPPRRSDPGPGVGLGLLQARFVWQDYRLADLELDHVSGAARPFINDRVGNRRIDYELRLSSARIELAYGFEGAGMELDIFGGLGFGWTELSVDAQNNSAVNNGADAEVTVRTEDADFDLSFGMDVWARVSDRVLIGFGSQLLYVHAEMDDQLLFNPSDVVLDTVVADITVFRLGGQVADYATLWAGVGLIVVGSELTVHEKGGGHWETDLGTDDTVLKGLLGASLHPGDDLTANIELALMPDPQLRVQVGWSF